MATIVSPMLGRYAPTALSLSTPIFSKAACTRLASCLSSEKVHRTSSRASDTLTIASTSLSGESSLPCFSIFSAKLSSTLGKYETSGIVSPSLTGVMVPLYSTSTKSISLAQNSSLFSTDHFHSSSYPPSTMPTDSLNLYMAVSFMYFSVGSHMISRLTAAVAASSAASATVAVMCKRDDDDDDDVVNAVVFGCCNENEDAT
mmetsp:Transcript_16704/g.24774  ORF Transcript_16704/g.24774 Transcript_16704/m.24774 type:complete len:202 (-) Transcript_16704:137-742(-)